MEAHGRRGLPGAALLPVHQPHRTALRCDQAAAGRRRGSADVPSPALKYENFTDIQGGLEPGSKRDSQGLGESSNLGDLDSPQILTAPAVPSPVQKGKEGAASENLEVRDENN
ncbi:unnamed protein product [Oncorhynchus mykiss]|uniref:Uncharacterized protein n=1 Tax=Oncorhynchus mykiss TaxID=8022 RepID=A0A060WUX8_ONCMY|nr:unnamed protein product [Oncorhynchus mykiss]